MSKHLVDHKISRLSSIKWFCRLMWVPSPNKKKKCKSHRLKKTELKFLNKFISHNKSQHSPFSSHVANRRQYWEELESQCRLQQPLDWGIFGAATWSRKGRSLAVPLSLSWIVFYLIINMGNYFMIGSGQPGSWILANLMHHQSCRD